MAKNKKPVEISETELDAVAGAHQEWIYLESISRPITTPTSSR